MSGVGWLPAPAEELFGAGATAEESFEVLTVDVPSTAWVPALLTARDELGCTYFDWLSAVDEPGTGLRVSAHVVALAPVRRLLLRTTVPHEAPVLPTAVEVYAGAAWHERETHEMFGVRFEGHPALEHLLLPENFEGHPLRKDFVLAARVAKAWPGAKEPGESDHGGPKRRQMLPPGVPDPNEWGPLKGQLPPAPARAARGAARAAGDRPVRRTRTAAEGSASQSGPTRPRRMRSASEGSASQRAAGAQDAGQEDPAAQAAAGQGPTDQGPAGQGPAGRTGAARPRRMRSASEGSASQRAAGAQDTGRRTPAAPAAPRGSDAPWHRARPAFDEPEPEPGRKPEDEPGRKPEDDTSKADGPKADAPKVDVPRTDTPEAGTPDTPDTPDTPGTPDDSEGGPR
ncbi:NADH-quinone oxidoreductase subunit C [Streptomyces thermoalcalitolerans]|uniref:NADH-quinone oxidoreductase subunit C n=1 Tax=Streptomyces thermoalcalitolerans TaxID=65605 RepID=A0ABP3YTL5_9ACTN